MNPCFKCGSQNLQGIKKTTSDGKLKTELSCLDCGARNGFWAYPMTLELAVKLKMPYGKFKGITLGEIARREARYLLWMRKNIEDKNIVDAINLVIRAWVTKTKGEQ